MATFRSIHRDIFAHINASDAKSGGFIDMTRALIIPGDAQFNLANAFAFQFLLKGDHRLFAQSLPLQGRENIKIVNKRGAHCIVWLVPEIANLRFYILNISKQAEQDLAASIYAIR